MNAGKRITPSLLIVILVASALISAFTRTPLADGKATSQAEQMKTAPAANSTVGPNGDEGCDVDGDKDADEAVGKTPASLLELVEFYSRKYFKFALDYLFEILNALGIFAPDDLA
ncbi:MAG: hypothetical protein AB7U82_07845 [Blastocatellales bacterium]